MIERERAIPDEIWRKVDSPPIDIGTPQTIAEWAQYADRLRCALADALHAQHSSGLIEALRLADALLRGANMDRDYVERKVSAALASVGVA